MSTNDYRCFIPTPLGKSLWFLIWKYCLLSGSQLCPCILFWQSFYLICMFSSLLSLIVQRSQFYCQVSIALLQNLDTTSLSSIVSTYQMLYLVPSRGDKETFCFLNVCSNDITHQFYWWWDKNLTSLQPSAFLRIFSIK